MIIDCGTCTVRGDACADCVVTFLTIPVRAATADEAHGRDAPAHGAVPSVSAAVSSGGAPAVATASSAAAAAGAPGRPGAGGVDLDDAERAAIAVLAGQGLVPPLRLVRAV
ncbi:hypothetical protein [Actinotalea solisilvae]|uniref:hypothetical protein n=1 Tax=Actinotalea solisilvae TaxID=2072922 RepID=UPI0018F1316B|nr:hypothetical protein [Actinotalea solisilvae]